MSSVVRAAALEFASMDARNAMLDTRASNRIMRVPRGNSSVGRARPCQGRGRECESRFPLQLFAKPRLTGVLFFPGNLRSSRSRCTSNGQVAEWSCSGLQSRVRRFDSDLGLHCAKAVVQPSKPAAGGFFVAAGCRTPTLRLAPGLGLKSVAGARGGGRTRIALRRRDFKSLAYTSFATRAGCRRALQARLQAARIVACAGCGPAGWSIRTGS